MCAAEGTILSKGVNYWFGVSQNNDALEFMDLTGAGHRIEIPVNIPVKKWSHVAFVREPDGQTIKMYFNGQFIGGGQLSTTGTCDSHLMSFGNAMLGATSACEFFGTLDEIQLFSGALTDAQVAAEYHYLPTNCPYLPPPGGMNGITIRAPGDPGRRYPRMQSGAR